MKKNKTYLLGIVLILSLAFFSCQKKIEKEYNWAYPVAGDWTLKAHVDNEEVAGPFEVKIYNTSFGQDSIWIDDYNGNFWDMKLKAKVDMSTKTFETAGSPGINYKIEVEENGETVERYPIFKVMEGKVVNTDSIYFKMEFEDDPGTIYTISGHRTTSYDEYMQN